MKSFLLLALLSFFTINEFNCQNDSPNESPKLTDNNNTTTSPMDEIPYHQIPDAPESFTAATVAARTIDGLGYRFYWASEGLTEKDLAYDPGNDNRSPQEMIEHFYGLSEMVLNSIKKLPNVRPREKKEMTFEKTRVVVLQNLKAASDLLRATPDMDMSECKIIFQRGEKKSEVPFWNLLNGPLADAIYHTGQLVSYRRSSGNPMNPNVNVFMGKTKE